MHPLLVPGSWLLDGRYYPSGRSAQHVAGVTEVTIRNRYKEMAEALDIEEEVEKRAKEEETTA